MFENYWMGLGVSVKQTSEIGLLRIGSREGITLKRIGPSSYEYDTDMGTFTVIKQPRGLWLVTRPWDVEPWHGRRFDTLRNARVFLKAEIGSKEGITLTKLGPGVYTYQGKTGMYTIDKQGRLFRMSSPSDLRFRYFPSLRDVRREIAKAEVGVEPIKTY